MSGGGPAGALEALSNKWAQQNIPQSAIAARANAQAGQVRVPYPQGRVYQQAPPQLGEGLFIGHPAFK